MAADHYDNTEICTACGLCCDGTLFGFVKVEMQEQEVMAGLGVDIIEKDGVHGFRQACPMLKGFHCSCYSVRPATCRTYKCRTLRALEGGEIAYAEARRRIVSTRDAVDRLNALLAPGQTIAGFYEQMAPTGGDPKASGSDPRAQLQAAVLQLLLDRYFRSDKQKTFKNQDGKETLSRGANDSG